MRYIDLHCDTISVILKNGMKTNLRKNNLQIDLEKLKHGQALMQCFAMFVYLKNTPAPLEYCLEMIDCYYQELTKNKDLIAPVFDYNDIENNSNKGLISSMLTIEEGGVVQNSLANLRILYRLGVRMICLNWNFENGVGHPNFKFDAGRQKPDFKKPNKEDGLTEFGFSMVKEMNRLGIIVDVSHLSDKGFYDCIKTSTKPIVASHSNARTICNHCRNLDDEMIKALAKNGGVMGMNFCADFLNEDEEKGKNTIDEVIKHMKYIKQLVGVDVIALGSDFDGINPNIKLANAAMMPKLFEAMEEAGFTEEEIAKISYKNFMRVLKANIN